MYPLEKGLLCLGVGQGLYEQRPGQLLERVSEVETALLSRPEWMCKYNCYVGRCGLSLAG